MKKYEMLYILSTKLADEARDAIIAKFEGVIASNGGAVEKVDKQGVKKLAYPINYETEGFYVLMTFECNVNLIDELKRVARITDGILRRLITRA
ncbi:MAG: 30S ribosomal protein S6 [Clostridia bacterium]|nr:30S ribosomal protein S6 [Clostridia bacterium]